MSKEEFLQLLRQALAGEVPQSVIAENIRYYDEYINGEAGRGTSEAAVIAEIGDPRLIAKTIIEATESAGGGTSYRSYEENSSDTKQPYGQHQNNGSIHYYNLNKWYWKFLMIAMVTVVLFLVLSVVAGVFSILIPLFGPILMILIVVWFIKNLRR